MVNENLEVYQEDQIYELQIRDRRGGFKTIAKNVSKNLDKKASFAERVNQEIKKSFSVFNEDDELQDVGCTQRKVLLSIIVKKVTFKGIPSLVAYFRDLSNKFNELALFDKFTTMNHLLKS